MSDLSYLDAMPDFPPADYSDEDFMMPDTPYPGEDFAGFADDAPDLWRPSDDLFNDALPSDAISFADEAWRWHDARLIGVEREADDRYEIGVMDVYANRDTGDLGASYLSIAAFPERDVAVAFYNQLEEEIAQTGLAPDQMLDLLEERAQSMHPEPQNWRTAGQAEYAAYDFVRGLDEPDMPAQEAVDPLLAEAYRLGGVLSPDPARAALDDIGVRVDHFDAQAPPAFYDEASDTRYWIGVFQPEADERDPCITAILSLAPDEAGRLTAQLAPCAVSDWDTAYANAEFLIEQARNGGIERVFETAEAMARGAHQHDLWQTERGLPLDAPTTQAVQEAWEADIER